MKALRTLIRVNKSKVDDKRRVVMELERLAQGFLDRLAQLEAESNSEAARVKAAFDPAIDYGAYIRSVMDRRKRLKASLAETERQIAAASEEVRLAYAEQKRFELTLAERERREAEEAERRDQAATDEVGLNIFRRKAGRKTAPK